jgi:RHS repeat-associated protein
VRGLVNATTGRVVERVSYDAYGVGRHSFPGDTDGDGSFGAADLAALNAATANNTVPRPITDANYNPDLDVNADGTIDGGDYTALGVNPGTTLFASAMPAGRISSGGGGVGAPDNDVGYCGYMFNHETQDYHVRFRAYAPRWGRWLQRDPAGYVDGMGLYEYARSRSANLNDPFGLESCGCSEDEGFLAMLAKLFTMGQDKEGDQQEEEVTRDIEVMRQLSIVEKQVEKVNDGVDKTAEEAAAAAILALADPESRHHALTALGFIPGFGIIADLANAALYATEARNFEALCSAAASVPGIGDLAAGGKLGKTIAKWTKELTRSREHASNVQYLMSEGGKQGAAAKARTGVDPASILRPGEAATLKKLNELYPGRNIRYDTVSSGKGTDFVDDAGRKYEQWGQPGACGTSMDAMCNSIYEHGTKQGNTNLVFDLRNFSTAERAQLKNAINSSRQKWQKIQDDRPGGAYKVPEVTILE